MDHRRRMPAAISSACCLVLSLALACRTLPGRGKPAPKTELELVHADDRGVEVSLRLPELARERRDTPGGSFERLVLPLGDRQTLIDGPEYVSRPEVPVVTLLVAMPLGAKLEGIDVEPSGMRRQAGVRLMPVQPPTRASSEHVDKVEFAFDEKVYLDAPSAVTRIANVRPVRTGDMNLVAVSLFTHDYEPRKQELVSYDVLNYRLRWIGGGECFWIRILGFEGVPHDLVDEYWQQAPPPLLDELLNGDWIVRRICPPKLAPVDGGDQFLIVSHPDVLPAAMALETHKESRGISTRVISTATIGTAPNDDQIRDHLRDLYGRMVVKPRWLLLLGDSEFLPTHYTSQQNTWDTARNAGDQFYGQLYGDDLSIPILGVGRLPVDTLREAQEIVQRIVAFETSPPASSDPYYADLTFAAQFQDDGLDGTADRWFAETAEWVRDHLTGLGLDVERIYSAPSASNPTSWTGGTTIPSQLQRPSFAWSGSTADIVQAIDDGTSLLFHRDHGWWSGWGTPSFGTGTLASLSIAPNHAPVVFSINCASGIFDNETVDLAQNVVGGGYGPSVGATYWAEQFLRMPEGALAVVGDTRSSSTTANDLMARGLFDAVFPALEPFGGTVSIRKLGDVLNHAKSYVAASGQSQSAVRQENTIYNLLGDPTLDVATRRNWVLIPQKYRWLERTLELPFGVEPICTSCPRWPEGASGPVIAVAQDERTGEVLARALATKEKSVRLELAGRRGPLVVTLSGNDVLTSTVRVP